MSVSIKYKGNEIASMTASGTKTLKTAGKYCEGDITVQNTEASQQEVEQATPTLSVNTSTGVVTAEATQEAGNVAAGTKTATLQLPTQAAKTVRPSAATITAVAAGKYVTGNVTVSAVQTETKTVALSMANGDQTVIRSPSTYLDSVKITKPDTLLPENIKSGVDIGGVVGTLEGGALGAATQVYVVSEVGTIADGIIISQTGADTFVVKTGISGGPINAAVGGMLYIVSPSTPIAIHSGTNVDLDYIMASAASGNGYDHDTPSPAKAVKVTAAAAQITISDG